MRKMLMSYPYLPARVTVISDRVPEAYSKAFINEPDEATAPLEGFSICEDKKGRWHVWPAPKTSDEMESLVDAFFMHRLDLSKVYLAGADFERLKQDLNRNGV